MSCRDTVARFRIAKSAEGEWAIDFFPENGVGHATICLTGEDAGCCMISNRETGNIDVREEMSYDFAVTLKQFIEENRK